MAPLSFHVSVLLLACALGSVSCFSESIRMRKADTLKAHYCEACVEYSGSGLRVAHQTVTVRIDPTPAPGHTESFHITVDFITDTTSAYFTFLQTEASETQAPSSVRLVWFFDGDKVSAEWEYYVYDKPFTLGPSHVLPETGPHTVTFMTNSEGFVVVEDGAVVGTATPGYSDYIIPSYDLTLEDVGAAARIALTEMTFQRGFFPSPSPTTVVV